MNNTDQPTSTLNLRNNLRKYGFTSEANSITQAEREYRKACRGTISVPGGNTGSYKRWQEAIERGRTAMSSLM